MCTPYITGPINHEKRPTSSNLKLEELLFPGVFICDNISVIWAIAAKEIAQAL